MGEELDQSDPSSGSPDRRHTSPGSINLSKPSRMEHLGIPGRTDTYPTLGSLEYPVSALGFNALTFMTLKELQRLGGLSLLPFPHRYKWGVQELTNSIFKAFISNQF